MQVRRQTESEFYMVSGGLDSVRFAQSVHVILINCHLCLTYVHRLFHLWSKRLALSLKLNAVNVSLPFGVSVYVTSYCNNNDVNSIQGLSDLDLKTLET